MVKLFRYKFILLIGIILALLFSVFAFSVSRAQWVGSDDNATVSGSIGEWTTKEELTPETDYGIVLDNKTVYEMAPDTTSGYIISVRDVQVGTALRIWYEGKFIDWPPKDSKIPLEQRDKDKTYYYFTQAGNFKILVQDGAFSVWEFLDKQ